MKLALYLDQEVMEKCSVDVSRRQDKRFIINSCVVFCIFTQLYPISKLLFNINTCATFFLCIDTYPYPIEAMHGSMLQPVV